ncbi:MAG: hypothetical protein F9K29_22385 [Hyphomicrobiaceae bacterium]|nr:MAG: hypothetical protein F9K29_22385 [Hyphomicrobiaceae bacterium]
MRTTDHPAASKAQLKRRIAELEGAVARSSAAVELLIDTITEVATSLEARVSALERDEVRPAAGALH